MAENGAGQKRSTATVKVRERYNRDEDVMAEAIAVISEKGYAATSIQEVADRVGVLKGSLYHYFSSKEELLYRILGESYAQWEVIRAEAAALGLEPLDELLEYLRRSANWYLENRDRATIFFNELRNLTGERAQKATEWGREFERATSDLVDAGQRDGSIRDDLDQRLISRFILGAVNNVRSWPSRRSGKHFSNEAIVEALVMLVNDAIVARKPEPRS